LHGKSDIWKKKLVKFSLLNQNWLSRAFVGIFENLCKFSLKQNVYSPQAQVQVDNLGLNLATWIMDIGGYK
jgi:hypothetical protein